MPAVSGIVRDASDRVLLVQSRDDNSWSTPGGSIELTDTPADAVVREVWEETGLLVSPTRVIALFGGPDFVVRYPNGDETQYVSTMFECEIRGGSLLAHGDNSDEILAAGFFSYDDARDLPLGPWLPPILPRLYDRDATWFEPPTWTPA